PLMLDEMNLKYAGLGHVLEVVVLLGDETQVHAFWSGLDVSRWPFLNIYLRQGDLLAFETYERVSIFSALGIVLLRDETKNDAYQADSQNIKTLAMLSNEGTFQKHLEKCHL